MMYGYYDYGSYYSEHHCDYYGCHFDDYYYTFGELEYYIEEMYLMTGASYDIECYYEGCWAYDLDWDYGEYGGGWFMDWEGWGYFYESFYDAYYCDALDDWHCNDWGCNEMSYEELEYGIAYMYKFLYDWDFELECTASGCTEYWVNDYSGERESDYGSHYGWCYWDELYGEFMDDYYGGSMVDDWYCNDWGCNDMSYEELEYGIAFMYKALYDWDFELECTASGCTEYWAPRDYYDDGTHYGWEYWEELYYFMDDYYGDYYATGSDYYNYYKEDHASVNMMKTPVEQVETESTNMGYYAIGGAAILGGLYFLTRNKDSKRDVDEYLLQE